MGKTDEYLINRLAWKARKSKLPTEYSFFFDDLATPIQKYLTDNIDLNATGSPTLFFTKPTKEWTLICTRKVVYTNNTSITSFRISDISEFKPTAWDNVRKGKSTNFNSAKKTEWEELTVIDKSGTNYILHANKGADLFALWNILLMMARLTD